MIQKDFNTVNHTQEMHQRNCTDAMKLMNDNMLNMILPLNQKTLNQLKQKHSWGTEAELHVLLTDILEQVHRTKFDIIDADLVNGAVDRTRVGAGPSGLDADGGKES